MIKCMGPIYLRHSSIMKIHYKTKFCIKTYFHLLPNCSSTLHFSTNKVKNTTKSNGETETKVARKIHCLQDDDKNPISDLSIKKERWTKVREYFSLEEHLKPALNHFPPDLLRMKKKFNELYLAEQPIADEIVSILEKHIPKECDYVVEVNPGPGLLTERLLKRGYRLMLFEANEQFLPQIKKLKTKNSNLLSVKFVDFMQLHKLRSQDFHDGGSRVNDVFQDFEKKPWESGAIKIIVGVAKRTFIRNLVTDCFRPQGLPSYGCPELYCYMTPSIFRKFTSTPLKDKSFYRAFSVLFQTLFDCEILTMLPRQSFLPWATSKKAHSSPLINQMDEEDKCFLYLVKIVGKKNFYVNMESQENIDLYWKFVRQFFKYTGIPIIPHLEKWFPNCGPKLISVGVGVFTQFSDLAPADVLNLFAVCKNFPDFERSPFFYLSSQFNMDDPPVNDEKKSSESGTDDSTRSVQETEADEEDDELSNL